MEKILIIEDDNLIAELERDYLEANNFEVEIENNGKSGLIKAKNHKYDAILLDIMLPEINGFEIAREIRKSSLVPILMITAKKEEIDMVRGFGIGVDDYILKPFSPSELVARVKAHLSIHQKLTSRTCITDLKVFIFDNLKVIPDSYQVYKDDNEIILTNKEFELLLFLINNKNIVLSKDVLFDKIWGVDSFGDTATVAVHINRLRDKIEDDSSNPKFIQTVWGAGYKFKA